MVEIKYYLIGRRDNVVRELDNELSYLDHETGEWVMKRSLFNDITGAGGDACTYEISKSGAQTWVKKHHPRLLVEWI